MLSAQFNTTYTPVESHTIVAARPVQNPYCPDQIMTPTRTDTPESIPSEVADTLRGCSDDQLRGIIHYAQQLLREHPGLTDAIEARAAEDILRKEDHGSYTLVVVERPDETGEARGPFAYRVKWEPDVDGEAGKYRWHYLGKVYGEAAGEGRD